MISREKLDFVQSLSSGGRLEPATVVEAARDPASPIYEEFNWNVQEAAEAHWLDTARKLIRFVRLEVTIEDTRVVAPFYLNDPERPPKSRRYIETTLIGQNRELAERVMLDELDRITNAIRRAQSVAAVLGMSERLELMLENVQSLKTKAERAANHRRRPPGKRPPRKRSGAKSARRGRAA